MLRFFATVLICASAMGAESASWPLAQQVAVDSKGVFLKDLLIPNFSQALPTVRVADAPAFGKAVVFNRNQLLDILVRVAPDLNPVWSGADRIRVVRRSRALDESEMKQLLTASLQNDQVRERGELELHFVRGFGPVTVPDEALKLRILDLPNSGVTPNFIARCELRAGEEIVGTWQVNVNAKIWREIWVARSSLLRGQTVQGADIGQERRDVLSCKDALAILPSDLGSYDLAENMTAGQPLTARSLKQRPIITRGKTLDAMVQEGALTIAVKVEALEDGLPGQIVRVRNIKSRREFRGKVQDEQTIAVAL
jgi:flagella basal body P-ring formation protein FlgA